LYSLLQLAAALQLFAVLQLLVALQPALALQEAASFFALQPLALQLLCALLPCVEQADRVPIAKRPDRAAATKRRDGFFATACACVILSILCCETSKYAEMAYEGYTLQPAQ
jgi:hypothetical protein